MTALAKDFQRKSMGSTAVVSRGFACPVAASTTIYKGAFVALNASGYLVPASANRNLRIVGVAEDTDGALMLTTSDPVATREAFAALGLAFEEHDPTGGLDPDSMSFGDLRPGAAGRGSLG